jgi:hypothetical protein
MHESSVRANCPKWCPEPLLPHVHTFLVTSTFLDCRSSSAQDRFEGRPLQEVMFDTSIRLQYTRRDDIAVHDQ